MYFFVNQICSIIPFPGIYYSYPVGYNFYENLTFQKEISKFSPENENNQQNQRNHQNGSVPQILLKNCSQLNEQFSQQIKFKKGFQTQLELGSLRLSDQRDNSISSYTIQIKNQVQKLSQKIFTNNNKKKSTEKQTKNLKMEKSQSNHSQSEDYIPHEKVKKTCDLIYKKNQNRNIIPNQVNQIFSYIQKISKSGYVLKRLFKKYPPENEICSQKRFYLYQSLLKQQISNYINEHSLSLVTKLYEPKCQIYSETEQRYYNKICRILIHYFLQQDSIFNILTSKRMKNQKKKRHLEMRRVLKEKALQILRS